MKQTISFLVLASCSTWLGAQDEPPHVLRILSLGDPPPFLQEVRDGTRYEIPPEEGTIPPRYISLSIGSPVPGEDQTIAPMRLRLGTPSAPFHFSRPANGVVTALDENGDPWLRISLAEGPTTLALVWKTGESWNQVGVLPLADIAPNQESGCRFINATAKPMALTWGSEKLKLNPASVVTRPFPPNLSAMPLMIQFPSSEGVLRSCLTTQIEPRRGVARQFIVYAADRPDARMPVKVLPLAETQPAIPLLSSKER